MTRVLVVDDDTRLLRTLHITLTARGYDVITAPDGTTALRAAARHHPDVVVLDLGLPDLDGADVVSALRERSTVPVVVPLTQPVTVGINPTRESPMPAQSFTTNASLGMLYFRVLMVVRSYVGKLAIVNPAVTYLVILVTFS